MGIAISEKVFRIGAFVFSLGRAFRIGLWLAGASETFRLSNEIFIRWTDTALCFAVCVDVIYWFKMKMHV